MTTDSITADQSVLAVTDVGLRFGGISALDGVSFTVASGSTLGVVGPNGAGKTALLNCISGTYRPQSGRIVFDGTDICGARPHKIAARGMVRTFQSTDHFSDFAVADYLLLSRSRHVSQSTYAAALLSPWATRKERTQRNFVMDRLRRLSLERYATTPLHALPYGVQRRVDLLRAELSDAHLVLLDEPTSGTMSADREAISDAVDELAAAGKTLLIVDHDVDFVVRHCDSVIAMRSGQLLATGTPDTVFAHPDVKKAFLGFLL